MSMRSVDMLPTCTFVERDLRYGIVTYDQKTVESIAVDVPCARAQNWLF